ncbi:putative serine protease K12H4.7-like protein, partial [Dinothrombium tinctorium]
RYFVDETFFKEGAPVFLHIGGEGRNDGQGIERGQLAEHYAPRFNALLLSLEHRFYGESRPTKNLSVLNLKYLSSQQALADISAFIKHYKEIIDPRTKSSKWIVFGCSYAGSLAAWMRLKYPKQVIGAVSSSGPVQAELNFKQYLDVISKAIGPDCASNVRKATKQLYLLIKDKNQWTRIKNKLHLCENFDGNNPKDVSTLFLLLVENFEDIVQYNMNNRNIRKTPLAKISTKTICEMMANESLGTEFDRYAAVNELVLETNKKQCLQFTYENMTKLLREINYDRVVVVNSVLGDRRWFYQTCNEFGFFQSTDSQNQPFGHFFPIEYFLDICPEIFGKKFDAEFVKKNVKFTNDYYGGKKINVSNVIFVQGSADPWHVLGVTNYTFSTSKAILIDGASHCSDTHSDSINDTPQLRAARKEISDYISFILEYF